jgi:hypothetical protein
MKLRTFALALVALCLTVVANAHPIGKYIRHRNIATADHIYSYNGHGHDKYSRVYDPSGKDENFYHCSGLGHHVNCKHGSCHFSDNGHHRSRHACRHNRHDHRACTPHSGSSCGHHGCANVCKHRDYIPCSHMSHASCGNCADGDKEEVVEREEAFDGNSKKVKIKISEE